jgi:aldose sugar dehydrogenase
MAGLGKRTRVALVAAVVLAVAFGPGPQHTAWAGIAGEPVVIASGLQLPWEVVLVPDGRILITERPGRIRVLEVNGTLRQEPAYESLGGQFLGLALHPSYASNRFVYLYNTYPVGGGWTNRIQRFVDNGSMLSFSKTVLDGIPGENNHDGGRIGFGPDGKLYATTGDVHNPTLPQNTDSLAGKILRLNAPGDATDGSAPADNPFPGGTNSRYVWSYGHRHPQGIDWDAAGRLWSTEHGPSGELYAGVRCCRDEVNLIVRGGNYGWPVIMGDERQAGMRGPVASSGDAVVWAPAGASFGPDGHFYFSNLAGQHLREMTTSGFQVTEQREHFRGRFGRLRAATYGRGHLYLSTSNNGSDEKLLRVPVTGALTPQGGALDRLKPVARRLRLRPRRFRAARRGRSIISVARTSVFYRLSEDASVRFTVERALPGRKVGTRCRKLAEGNRGRRRCRRYSRLRGGFTHRGKAGANGFRFSGRLRGRRLRPGGYRLVARPTDAARNRGKSVRARFRVLRPRLRR